MNNRWRDNLIAPPPFWANGLATNLPLNPFENTEAPTGVEIMARTPKATDIAAQAHKADVDQQKREQGSLAVGDQQERTPPASELIKDHPEVFGEKEGEAGKAETKTPQERQLQGNIGLTADQRAVANGDEPVNKPADGAPDIGDRVILVTATPISGQTETPSFVIGYSPMTGNPNLRLEYLDGGQGRPVEFGNVPYGKASEERGPYYLLAGDFEPKNKASDKADD